jgi:hypothetical protein
MIVSNIRPPSSSLFRMDLKIQESRRETAELCNQPTDYTFPVMMIPVDITRGSLPDGTQHTHTMMMMMMMYYTCPHTYTQER